MSDRHAPQRLAGDIELDHVAHGARGLVPLDADRVDLSRRGGYRARGQQFGLFTRGGEDPITWSAGSGEASAGIEDDARTPSAGPARRLGNCGAKRGERFAC